MPTNLNEHGLSDGDTIDPYLDQYWESGAHVTIDPGHYYIDNPSRQFPNSSFYGTSILEGTGGPGNEVELEHTGSSLDAGFWAGSDGEMYIRHITFLEGDGSYEGGSIRLRASAAATVTLENVNRPDGNDPAGGWGGAGIFVPDHHAGEINVINCHIEGFYDNGLYGSAPGNQAENDPREGQVNVYGGLYKNNNISNIRIGTDNSRIIGAACVQDTALPSHIPGPNQRNIWLREIGQNMVVEDVDIYHARGSYWLAVSDDTTTGRVDDCRIYTENSSLPAIGDVSSETWTSTGCHVTGPGDHSNAMGTNACSGSGCDVATREKRWYESDGPVTVDPTDGNYWGWNPHNTDDSLRIGKIELYDEHPFGDHA